MGPLSKVIGPLSPKCGSGETPVQFMQQQNSTTNQRNHTRNHTRRSRRRQNKKCSSRDKNQNQPKEE